MSKLTSAIALATLASNLFVGNALFAKDTNEGLEEIQPIRPSPRSVLGALPIMCASEYTETADQSVRFA